MSAASARKLIIVLEQAALETVKTKRGFELLNADEHKGILAKNKRDPSKYRPDIVHQLLLTLLDSPLNKAGMLQIYIHTWNNVLIEVDPACRIPRTFKRFCGLMVQLLHKLSIRATDSSKRLLRVIKNPITAHLPVGCRKLGASETGELVNPRILASEVPEGEPVVIMLGAHSHGACEVDWVEKYVSVSSYTLSAAAATGKLISGFEEAWGIM